MQSLFRLRLLWVRSETAHFLLQTDVGFTLNSKSGVKARVADFQTKYQPHTSPAISSNRPGVWISRGGRRKKHCFSDHKKASNLEAYVEWFNRLSYLVATEICMPVKKKHRARVIEFFIDVARECFNIGNFNSLMAIISGMNMSPVSRLKKTWSKVKTAKFDILEVSFNPQSCCTRRLKAAANMWGDSQKCRKH
uniref:Ras-GEF domain-containing protein n=1 Tax=Acanthochromis polyacanthus TaxID=80966 RepID=A0A3Q1HA15_9TELE